MRTSRGRRAWREDYETNARNTFGLPGAVYPLFPDKGLGASFYYTGHSAFGLWPYWISAGGWRLRPFWDHYLVTGDADFLRTRVVPALKELALFYEGFLTTTDPRGHSMFVPSVSPENMPVSLDPSGPVLINATMDIAVCREVLSNLIQASEMLGTDAASIPRWEAMLAKMPPYLVELDGTLKEWAWPTLQERYAHRHVSHLYGVWPGDEIDPDRTPQLARAAEIACRKRSPDVMATAVAGETLPAYARCHRALVAARLKDNVLVRCPTAPVARAGLCQLVPALFTRAIRSAGPRRARRPPGHRDGDAALLASRSHRGASSASRQPDHRLDQRPAGPDLRQNRPIDVGHEGQNRRSHRDIAPQSGRDLDGSSRDRGHHGPSRGDRSGVQDRDGRCRRSSPGEPRRHVPSDARTSQTVRLVCGRTAAEPVACRDPRADRA